jgi:hypothetical protein
MISHFSIEISQFVEIFEPEVSKKSWKSLNYVEKSWKFSINLDSLDKSRQSRFVSTISINISTKINLDRKILILKISTEKKKKSILTWWIISTLPKNWSRQEGRSRSRSRSVSTVETPKVTFKFQVIVWWNKMYRFRWISITGKNKLIWNISQF